jgi:hypothetical protein
MEVSPQNIWSILVLAQALDGVMTFTSAPTHGPLPSASAQTSFATPEGTKPKVTGRASVEIVQGLEWRAPQRNIAGPFSVGGIRLTARLRAAQKQAGNAEPAKDAPLWVVDLP